MPTYSNTVSSNTSGGSGRRRNVSRVTRFFRPDAKHIVPRGSTGKDAEAAYSWRKNISDSQKQEWKASVDKWHETEKQGKIKKTKESGAKGASRASKKRKRGKAKQSGVQKQDPDEVLSKQSNERYAGLPVQDEDEDEEFFSVKAGTPAKTKQDQGTDDMEMEDFGDDSGGMGRIAEDDDFFGGAFSSKADLAELENLNASTTKSFIAKVKQKKMKKNAEKNDPAGSTPATKPVKTKESKTRKTHKPKIYTHKPKTYTAAEFVAAPKFQGAKAGFVFKKDALGLGYYKDDIQEHSAATNAAKATAAKGTKENTSKKAPTDKAANRAAQAAADALQKRGEKLRKVKMKAIDLGGGLLVQDTLKGSGKYSAVKGASVKILYTGSILSTGKKFDSCLNPNKPFEFVLGRGTVVPGMEIGLKGLQAGGKRIVVIPPELGYGGQVLKGIPMNSTLKFKIELLEVGPSNAAEL